MNGPQPSLITSGNIVAVPSFHCRAQFALEVRRAFAAQRPACVAVELAPALKPVVLQGLARLPSLSVITYPEQDGRHCYMTIDPCDSMIEAARLAVEHDLPLELIDQDVDNFRQKPLAAPDEYAMRGIGLPAYYERVGRKAFRSGRGSKNYDRERYMACRLRELSDRHGSVLFVLGMAHWERILGFLENGCKDPGQTIPGRAPVLANVTDESFPHVLGELPYVTYLYELARQERDFDKAEALRTLMIEAEVISEKEWGQRSGAGALRTLLSFTRNWAVTANRLLPDLYQMLVAGKNILSEEYAGELYTLAHSYPLDKKDPKLPTVDLRRKTGNIGGASVKIRRWMPKPDGESVSVPVRRPASKERREGWRKGWDKDELGAFHCSHVPEDHVLEDFAAYVRRRAMELLAGRRTKTLEFTSSLLDGIEVRETIRNWHMRRKLFVREEAPVKGRVGPVVAVFEEDDDFRRYPWLVTWLSEFEYECDLALYATEPGAQVVGPGISRSEYGGFACIWPAQRIRDVWSNPEFDRAVNKSERLLMAAIKYAKDPFIAYTGPQPPRAYIRSLAARKGRQIIYVPPGALSATAVGKVRQFHVLQGHHVRQYAKDYIR